MTIVQAQIDTIMHSYAVDADTTPLFIPGDAVTVLREIPAASFDCCITSPPYWGQRQYNNGGIGMEGDYHDYITHLLAVFAEVKHVLKPEGSFWLNIGDAYYNKHLLGLPWRVALALTDEQGWILRNSVIWHKVKGGPDNTDDRLRNVHENVFHFVQGVYFDPGDVNFAKNFGMNWKMTAKTTLMQLHHEAQNFEYLNKHLVLVIQDHFLSYMRRAFKFEHLNQARLGDPIHIHPYTLSPAETEFRLSLGPRFSTDTAGIAECLGLQADPKIELQEITHFLESKINDTTLLAV